MPRQTQPPDIEAIRARWAGTPEWRYDRDNNWVCQDNPAHIIAQLWDKFEEDYGEYATNGPMIAAAPADVAALLVAADAWQLLAKARNAFLVAYRTGGKPPESAFAAIEKAERALGLR